MVSMRGYSQFRLSHECSEENHRCYRARTTRNPSLHSLSPSMAEARYLTVPQPARSRPHKVRPIDRRKMDVPNVDSFHAADCTEDVP